MPYPHQDYFLNLRIDSLTKDDIDSVYQKAMDVGQYTSSKSPGRISKTRVSTNSAGVKTHFETTTGRVKTGRPGPPVPPRPLTLEEKQERLYASR
uniref:Uncharacterized protein n=1 Tax=viral metagenome TaxID=1070528 RepID=A0A6C0KDJ3_9ZZZZ